MRIKRIVKRFLDITLGLMALIISLPIFLIVSLLVRIKIGPSVLFVQERVGRNGKRFNMYKFRTMLNSVDADGKLLSDEKRMTTFGKALRSKSLDELPELLNIINGDMSLVGPRPLLSEYLPIYSEEQMKRHDVLPGITGWAQINGRNSISWQSKLEFDIWYVENWSLLLDFKIMFRTIGKVIRKEGISQIGNATVERFNGFN